MIGPPLLITSEQPWPPKISSRPGSFGQLHPATGAWTPTCRLTRLVQRTSNSDFATVKNLGIPPDSGSARFRMIRCVAAAALNWAVSLCDHLETMIFTSEPNADDGSAAEEWMNYCCATANGFEPVSAEMAPTTDVHVTGTISVCDFYTAGGFDLCPCNEFFF